MCRRTYCDQEGCDRDCPAECRKDCQTDDATHTEELSPKPDVDKKQAQDGLTPPANQSAQTGKSPETQPPAQQTSCYSVCHRYCTIPCTEDCEDNDCISSCYSDCSEECRAECSGVAASPDDEGKESGWTFEFWAMLGFFAVVLTSLGSWHASRTNRKEKLKIIDQIEDIYYRFKGNRDVCIQKLNEIRQSVKDEYAQHKLDEANFNFLIDRIEHYVYELRYEQLQNVHTQQYQQQQYNQYPQQGYQNGQNQEWQNQNR